MGRGVPIFHEGFGRERICKNTLDFLLSKKDLSWSIENYIHIGINLEVLFIL